MSLPVLSETEINAMTDHAIAALLGAVVLGSGEPSPMAEAARQLNQDEFRDAIRSKLCSALGEFAGGPFVITDEPQEVKQ